MSTQTPAKAYTGDSIQIKEGIEHVRARPAMYIGDVYERGLHHMVSEVVDNSVDEAMAKHCTRIDVTIHEDGSITILDNGRGIPVDMHSKAGKPTLEVCLTTLGAGGKFDKDSYKVSGGLHGVGVSCVNALSEWLEAEVYREGKSYHMRFERGITVRTLEEMGPTKKRGTKITFKPDPQIFKASQEFKWGRVSGRLRELAYLNAGLQIVVRDERGEELKEEDYCFPDGIAAFVQEIASRENVLLTKPIYLMGSQDSTDSGGVVEVEIAIQYNDTFNETIFSYTNNINTLEGGTHLTGFRTALTATFNNWLKDNESKVKVKGSERPSGDDYREGLVAIVSVKVPEPQFEGQTKTKLGNSDIAGIVQTVLGQYLREWCEQNPGPTKRLVQKALQARKARLAAKKAKELVRMKKDTLRGGGVAKLTDCDSKDPRECELYLVEGDSAGGTAVAARDWRTQAILPLRGKILNVWKAPQDRMLNNNEISTMIQVLGTGILDEFNIEKLQFHKIIIMCDADVDGSHIRTLILTFFFRQMPELIQAGHVYVAQPPLYKVWEKGKKKAKEEYFLNDESFEQALLSLGVQGSTRLVRRGNDTFQVTGDALEELARLSTEITKLAKEVEKKGVQFKKFLARSRDGLLPHARIRAGGKSAPAAYTEDELKAWLAKAHEATPDLKVWRHDDPLEERVGADVEITTFTSKKRLEEILKKLQTMGFTTDDLFVHEERGAEGVESPFQLVKGSVEDDVWSLPKLAPAIREMAQKGLGVQRYKGLGEMDDSELRETTMSAANRTLLRVTLNNENMSEANQVFSVLMGSQVEPRRDFIETHAASVRADAIDA